MNNAITHPHIGRFAPTISFGWWALFEGIHRGKMTVGYVPYEGRFTSLAELTWPG